MGLEPTTFELEVQHANPLRHGGYTYDHGNILSLSYRLHFLWLKFSLSFFTLAIGCFVYWPSGGTCYMRNTIWSIKNK